MAIVSGSGDNDVLSGTSSTDIIDGGARRDVLSAGGGDDGLLGGLGNDILTGGPGSDTFVFGRLHDADAITDFSANDRLVLTDGIERYFITEEWNGVRIATVDLEYAADVVQGSILLLGVSATDWVRWGGQIGGASGFDQPMAGLIAFSDRPTVAGFILGSEFADELIGDARANRFIGNEDDDTIDGGAGLDTAFIAGPRTQGTVNVGSGGLVTTTGRDGNDRLTNVERIAFDDAVLAFDLGPGTGGLASAGENYRLYQAAFDRTPDLAGLSNNVRVSDAGLSLRAIASAFVVSGEFRTLYGETASDTTFVTALYQNVLNRAPDQAGLQGWLSALSSGRQDRAGVLIGFSESNENKALTQAAIQNGVLLDLSVVG